MKQFLRCEGHLSSILVFLLKKSYNFGIWYKKLASRVVRYAVKGPKPSIWASCNVLHQKLGSAAKIVLIPCSMQLCYQTMVLCAIFSPWTVGDLAPGRSRDGPRCARPWPWSRHTSDQSAVGARGGAKGSARCSPGDAWDSAVEGCVPHQLGYPPRASLASQEVTNYGSATNHGAKNTLLDRQKLRWTWLRY
jgi:hypothetical protein